MASAQAVALQEGEQETATLVIEVTSSETGLPLAGARVAVHWDLQFIHTAIAMGKREGVSARATLDEAGIARVEVPAYEQFLFYVAPTESTRLVRHVMDDLVEPGVELRVKLEAWPDVIPVSGRVVGDRGNPVAGARVTAEWGNHHRMISEGKTREQVLDGRDAPPSRSVLTDENGVFEFEGLEAEMFLGGRKADWLLSAESDGLAEAQRLLLMPHDVGREARGLEIRLTPTREVRGAVLGEDGMPIESAEVRVSDFHGWSGGYQAWPGVYGIAPGPLAESPFLTNAQGEFVIPELVTGDWTLRIDIPGRRGGEFVKVTEEQTEVSLSLVPDPSDLPIDIVGQVVDPNGKPIPGVALKYRMYPHPALVTDDEGQFVYEDLLPSGLGGELKFYAPGFAIHGVELPKERDDVVPLRVILQPERRVAGVLLDREGNPMPGHTVSISAVQPEDEDWPYWKRTSAMRVFRLEQIASDADGRFEFGSLWPGQWRVSMVDPEGPSGVTAAFRVVESGNEAVALQLGDGTTSVRGRVLDADTGLPIDDYTITPRSRGQGVPRQIARHIKSEDGAFEYPSLAVGEWTFTLEAKGYRGETTRTISLPSAEPLELKLGRQTKLKLRVQDSTGTAVPLAILDCKGLNGDYLAIQTIEPLGATDEDGYAELSDLPRGEVVLDVCPMASFVGFEFPVDLREQGEAALEITLPADFTSKREVVELVFRRSDGSPLDRSFAVRAIRDDGVIVAAWRMSYWKDVYSVVPGHDLASFFRELPSTEDCVMPLELPPGEYHLQITGERLDFSGPSIKVKPGEERQPIVIVVGEG